MSATEVPEIVQLVFNMELLAISSMSEVRSEHKVCFGDFFRLTKGFWAAKKSPKECDLRPPPPPPSAEKVTLSSVYFFDAFPKFLSEKYLYLLSFLSGAFFLVASTLLNFFGQIFFLKYFLGLLVQRAIYLVWPLSPMQLGTGVLLSLPNLP